MNRGHMESRDVHERLAQMLRRLVASPTLQPGDNLNFNLDLEGWNSFKFVELLIEAQQQFGVEFGARLIERIETFGDLVAAVGEARAR